MSRNSASTIATGGAGYTFADKVAATFLVQMLQRAFPFEPELGVIAEIHFETRERGNLLDDLQLMLRRGNESSKCTASVKSNRQLSKAGFNSEFVKDAWEQWQGAGGSKFNAATDILCLIAGVVDEQALQAWRELQKQARATTPERLVERLGDGNQFSAVQRKIFKSLGNTQGGSDIETARLAARVRLLHFSEDKEGEYINRCAEVVLDGTQSQGAKLWSRLIHLSSENRTTGGYFDLPKLIRVLRPDFELRDFPDYRADWERLERISSENIMAVRRVIGSDIHLVRQQEKDDLGARAGEHAVVSMIGESGSGKSALLAEFVGTFKRVLWLNAGQLSKPSQAELATAFGLTYDIPTLLAHSSLHGCVLVLDGFEHLEGEARHRAIQLMASLKDQDFTGWKLIITCQPQFWGSVQDVLVQTGINDFHKLDIGKPAPAEILAAVRHLSAIRGLLLRTDLQPFLCNLVVLDWVLRGDIAQRLSLSRARIGETDVIQRIWERWVGETDMRFARDDLLRLIGENEGEKLSGAVHVDSIPRDQLPLVGKLADEGLLHVTAPSVQFAHDLMGEWARFRILVFAGNDAPSKIKELVHVPRWNRAIRLYAQSLVEQGSGLEQWKVAIKKIGGDAPEEHLASDLFLDGLLFAANSRLLLEQVWQDLIADDGQILTRLLKRLMHVASFPDWRAQLVSAAKNADQMAAWFRVPLPLYWYPALLVLSEHAKDVAKHALIPAAEACALWLRTMPAEMPGRREAALLAVELAKETQDLVAEGVHFRDKDKVVYQALLSAGLDLPEEVAQIALELAGRRDEPDYAIQRAIEAQERQAKLREEWRKKHPERVRAKRPAPSTMISGRDSPLRLPDPDGPLHEVGEGFRSAVMDTPSLNGLVAMRPEVAKEVLLAVCIDEPKPIERHRSPLPLEGLGLADWHHGYPAMYWKGPFWKFLQDAPEQVLDAIVRVVNYATNRWLERGVGPVTPEQRQEYALDFDIDGKPVYWVGDCNVFGWHRSASLHAAQVECALMALEKWLYDEIENEREITRWVQYIFAHAESLAFAGVLVSVGLRYPGLFLRELTPLLGNYDLYQCQASWALHEQQETWTISLANQGEQVVKLAVDWNRMPHRRTLLRDVPYLMTQNEGLRKYLTGRAAEWAKRMEHCRNEKQRDDLRFFLARFDPQNYTLTPQPDGQVLIEMHWPPDLEAKAKESQEKSSMGMLAITLASQARAYLSGRRALSPEELPKFAAQVQRLTTASTAGADADQTRYRMDSIAGGIAVLIVLHRPWLAQNPEIEKWCLQTLRDLRPEDRELDTPHSAMDQSVESFRGEAGVVLLQESSEEWVLRMAFDGVTAFYYNATFQTMWRAYLVREQLGERFDEMVNVIVLWSALRAGANRESGYEANRVLLTKYKETLFKRLAAGKLRNGLIPLRKAESLGQALIERISYRSMSAGERRARDEHRRTVREDRRDRKLYREIPDIDFEVLQKGFGFLAAMSREPLPADEQRLRDYVRELYDLEMRTLPRPATDEEGYEVSGTAYPFDVWVMTRVIEFIVHENSVEVARTFYRPIMELGPAARYWVQDFLQAWIITGLEMAADIRTFAEIWREIVEYAMRLPAWQCGNPGYWCPAEPLAADLMGLQEGAAAVLGQAKHKDLIKMMAPVYEAWGSQWLKFGSVAAWLAHFLPTESGQVLLGQGIKQLAEAMRSFEDRDWHHYSLGPLLTEALAACWSHVRQEVESQPDLKKAFLGMLTALCARQIPEALHLRNKVSETLVTLTT